MIRRILISFLAALFLPLLVLSSAAAAGTVIGSETLVAKDIGRGGASSVSLFCGPTGLLVNGDPINGKIGLDLIDIATGQRREISSDPRVL